MIKKCTQARFLIPFWAGIELTRIVPIFLDQTWSGFVWNLGLSKMFSFVYSSNSEDLIANFQRNHYNLVWYFNNRNIVLMLQGILFGAKIVCRQKNVSPYILRAMCSQYISTGCPSEITFDISKWYPVKLPRSARRLPWFQIQRMQLWTAKNYTRVQDHKKSQELWNCGSLKM